MKALTLPFLLLLVTACSSESPVENQILLSNWDTYLGDSARTHYSELTQITKENVSQLELAWSYNSGELREGGSLMHTSPLIIDGILYGLSPRLVAFALNAATGEEIWRYESSESEATQRGLMWWKDGEDRRLLYAAGRKLIALNADTGQPITSFGDNGKLDLTPTGKSGPMFTSVPGVIFEDTVILGFSTTESDIALAGVIRAYSVIDGEELWHFNSLPLSGGLGSETWEEGSLTSAGGANNWTGMALDEERGMVFVPTGSATPDFFGASRKGDNLFANSLIALDARTGEYRWHYQTIRHDLWDRDLPSPPTLVQLERDGVLIDAVALTTKSGQLFLFNRDTGESLYEIYDVETSSSDVPGEEVAATQPVSSVIFTRQEFEMTTRSPAAINHVAELIKDLDQRPWAPPSLAGALIYPAFDGGSEWGGSAYDPIDHKLILNAQEIGGIIRLIKIPVDAINRGIYVQTCGACHGEDRAGTDVGPSLIGITNRISSEQMISVIREGRGRMPPLDNLSEIERNAILSYVRSADIGTEQDVSSSTDFRYGFAGYLRVRDHEGLPGNTPPWGTLNSIDLATGEIDWQINFGNYPSHPDLGYGAESYGGPVVTASGLIFIAATPDRKFRAYDSADGSILWETDLPAAGFATPAMYSVGGRQFVVIAAGGGRMGPPSGAEYLAFRLPLDSN
ncbi:MAG: PQQ-binding-like beta-propeller repeat protein [Proteobacteria bacterium]|nr:PQQ-binding-like beta-propeller repeat protein [Pseudomonadota bacterium]